RLFFFFQAEDGIRDFHVTGVQTCALPIWRAERSRRAVIFRGRGSRSSRSKRTETVISCGYATCATGIVKDESEAWSCGSTRSFAPSVRPPRLAHRIDRAMERAYPLR